jgi:hypothetical protein
MLRNFRAPKLAVFLEPVLRNNGQRDSGVGVERVIRSIDTFGCFAASGATPPGMVLSSCWCRGWRGAASAK